MVAGIRFAVIPILAGAAVMLGAETVPFGYEEALRRTWSHEILNFEVKIPKAAADLATMYVTDETGAVVPAQVYDPFIHPERPDAMVTVSVLADFQPWQKRTWMLHACEKDGPFAPATDMKAAEEKDAWVLSNDRIAVRVVRGSHTYKTPSDAVEVPAPILAVRGPSGKWIGRGWLESPQNVNGYKSELTHDGPIFKRVRVSYDFIGGRYICTLTLRTGEDVLHVRDEFDLGEPSKQRESNFCFSLKDGLAPDTVRWYGRCFGKRCNIREEKAASNKEAEFPLDYANPERLLRLHGLFVWWPEAASYWGAYRHGDPQSDIVAVFPERPGHWRNPAASFLEMRKNGDLVMSFPIRQPVQDWNIDGVDYDSPYYTGSISPDTPRTLGVREWGLQAAKAADVLAMDCDIQNSGIRKAWTRYGQNPLDKIKGWTLKWESPGAFAYPRGAILAKDLPGLRERVARIPALKEQLGRYNTDVFSYLVNPDPIRGGKLVRDEASGDINHMGLLPRMRNSMRCYLDTQGDLGSSTFMHHGIANLAAATPLFDVAMSVPDMTPEERREAMALYAFLIYKVDDPDWLAYGAGFHLGNPNMPTAAVNEVGSAGALVPEHPKAVEWTMAALRSTLDMLREFTAPGGAWRECPHYQMDASMRFTIQAADVMRNAGMMDLYRNVNFKSAMLYHLKIITPPDPRFGIRLMPAIGNTPYEGTSLYGRMAAGTAESDPAFSKWMQWGWKAVGEPYQYSNDQMTCNPDLPAEQPDLSSRHFPGFGTVMRSHVGDADEAYLLFRMGYQHEHYENEQGEIVFYARGVPLCLDFGSMYQPMMLRPWLHNCVSLNHRLTDGLGTVEENNLLDAADSCLGRLTTRVLSEVPEDPCEPTPPNSPRPSVEIAPTTWTRQVLFAKDECADGPLYVVIRDSLAGKGEEFSEFSLWNLAEKIETAGNVATCTGQLGVNLAVTFLDPAKPEFSTGEYSHRFLGGNTSPYWHKVNGAKKFEETQRFIRIKRSDHGGYTAVLYPFKPGEPVPTFAAWAGGAGASAVIAGEKHTVVCAEQPGTFNDAGVACDGQRALVREGKGRLVLALLQGTRLSAGGYSLTGAAPVAVTIADGKISGEANLSVDTTVNIECPAVPTAAGLVVTADGKETKGHAVVDGTTIRLALTAGRCTFRLE